MAEVDWSDPCARAEALRKAYYEMLTTGTSTRVRFRAGDNEQEVQKAIGAGSLADLRRAMLEAEDQCRAAQGLSPRRHAVTAGSRRIGRGPF